MALEIGSFCAKKRFDDFRVSLLWRKTVRLGEK
jgi:hypothetical protein